MGVRADIELKRTCEWGEEFPRVYFTWLRGYKEAMLYKKSL